MLGNKPWSFKQKISLAFALTIILTILVSIFSILTFNLIIKTKDIVTMDYSNDVIAAEGVHTLIESVVASSRAVLLTGDPKFTARMELSRAKLKTEIKMLEQIESSPNGKLMVEQIKQAALEYNEKINDLILTRKLKNLSSVTILQQFEGGLLDKRDQLELNISNFIKFKRELLRQGQIDSFKTSSRAKMYLIFITILSIIFMTIIALFFTKSLTKIYQQSLLDIQSREDIVAIVSHDLKNPISAIMLNAKMLDRKVEISDEKIKKLVTNIERSAERMNRLIYDLLDLARLESGQFQIDKKEYMIQDILQETLVIFEQLASEKSIVIQTKISNGNVQVLCDKDRIIQVFTNLIGNALKFTPPKGQVLISFDSFNSYSEFSISDTGPGIPQNQIPYIFERYKQAKVEDSKKGAGLGLYISKKIIDAHGGKIWVENNPESGATFKFNLPRT